MLIINSYNVYACHLPMKANYLTPERRAIYIREISSKYMETLNKRMME